MLVLIRFSILLTILFLTTYSASAVSIYIHTNTPSIEFMLIDYNNKKTGYDPNTRKHLTEAKQLPLMSYKAIWDEDPLATTPAPIEGYGLQGEFPVNNIILDMQLLVTGKNLSTSSIVLTLEEDNTGLSYPQYAQSRIKSTILDKDQVATYNVHYIPLQSISMIKIATSSDLIADITTAQKLNLIGNAKFVAELTKEINEIEAEKAKGKVDDGLTPAQKAKKEYTELLKEITEKYNKPEGDEYVKKEAYDVLKEDLEYIISHIQ